MVGVRLENSCIWVKYALFGKKNVVGAPNIVLFEMYVQRIVVHTKPFVNVLS